MRAFLRTLTFLILAAILTACAHKPLSVYKETLSPKTLASFFAGTPDPRKRLPLFGERFWIFWDIHDWKPGLILRCQLRFQNDELETYDFALRERRGVTSISIRNDEFLEKGEIVSYQLSLFDEELALESLTHPLFVRPFIPN